MFWNTHHPPAQLRYGTTTLFLRHWLLTLRMKIVFLVGLGLIGLSSLSRPNISIYYYNCFNFLIKIRPEISGYEFKIYRNGWIKSTNFCRSAILLYFTYRFQKPHYNTLHRVVYSYWYIVRASIEWAPAHGRKRFRGAQDQANKILIGTPIGCRRSVASAIRS